MHQHHTNNIRLTSNTEMARFQLVSHSFYHASLALSLSLSFPSLSSSHRHSSTHSLIHTFTHSFIHPLSHSSNLQLIINQHPVIVIVTNTSCSNHTSFTTIIILRLRERERETCCLTHTSLIVNTNNTTNITKVNANNKVIFTLPAQIFHIFSTWISLSLSLFLSFSLVLFIFLFIKESINWIQTSFILIQPILFSFYSAHSL